MDDTSQDGSNISNPVVETGDNAALQAERSWDETHTLLSEPGQFRSLDLRVIGLWRALHVINLGVLLVAALFAVAVIGFENPEIGIWLMIGWFLLAGLSVWLTIWRPPRLYRSWGYRIDARVLETRSGIVFRVLKLLPLSRLQHVDLQRGPIERMFGLASLVLHTAGTHEASIRIPGLDAGEARLLRDHLVEIGGDDAV
jgi:membrane protein YdbS with pleckstrin-like domain